MQEKKINKNSLIADSVKKVITRYLNILQDDNVIDLHKMVMEQVEPPLLEAVMKHCHYRQSSAAACLGISRGTLRTLLIKYFDEKYVQNRK